MFTQKTKNIILALIFKIGVFFLGLGISSFLIGLCVVEHRWRLVIIGASLCMMGIGACLAWLTID